MKILEIIKLILPRFNKSERKVSALNTILSKRGETTKIEVMYVFIMEIITKLFYAWIIWLIAIDKINLGDIFKILIGNFR